MEIERLQLLSRKDLQELAKRHGLKANKKTADLVTDLAHIYQQSNEETEEMEIVVPSDAESHEDLTVEDLEIGMSAKFSTHEETHCGTVKRLNKKSVRIVLENGSEVTVQFADIRGIYTLSVSGMTASDHSPVVVEEVVDSLDEQQTVEDITTTEVHNFTQVRNQDIHENLSCMSDLSESPLAGAAPGVENKAIPIVVAHKDLTVEDLEIGMSAKFSTHEETHCGTVKRLNKKSVRIVLENGSEVTVQFADIRGIYTLSVSGMTASDHSPVVVEEVVDSLDEQQTVEELSTEDMLETICEQEDAIAACNPFAPLTSTPEKNYNVEIIGFNIAEEIEESTCAAQEGIDVVSSQLDTSPDVAHLSPILEISMPDTPCPSRRSSCKRNSIVRSTKAQKARAEAIAVRQDRIDTAITALKSTPHRVVGPYSSSFKSQQKNGSDSAHAPSASRNSSVDKRTSSVHKSGWNNSFAFSAQKKPLFGSTRGGDSVTKDRVSIAQAAKAKANDFLAAKRKAAEGSKKVHKTSKVPNFKKLHEKNFSSQKAITAIVKENKVVQKQMSEAVNKAFDKHDPSLSSAISANAELSVPQRVPLSTISTNNPFGNILSRTAPKKKLFTSKVASKTPVKKSGAINKGMEQRRNAFHGTKKSDRQNKMNAHRVI